MLFLVRRSAVLLAVVSCGLTLAACTDDPARPSLSPTPSASQLGKAFYDSASPPPPEGTITPGPGSWSTVHPPQGWRVVLVRTDEDAAARTVARAVTTWAAAEHVELTTVRARAGAGLVAGVARAVALHPQLVISAGDRLVDPLATITAGHLRQQFLVVGAELAEPTSNVTAADWGGASFRGEGLGKPNDYDPASFTPERVGRAVRAGVAAVLGHLTGIVVRVT